MEGEGQLLVGSFTLTRRLQGRRAWSGQIANGTASESRVCITLGSLGPETDIFLSRRASRNLEARVRLALFNRISLVLQTFGLPATLTVYGR